MSPRTTKVCGLLFSIHIRANASHILTAAGILADKTNFYVIFASV